jgi:Zn2+/Cd2+-exporting ATPase
LFHWFSEEPFLKGLVLIIYAFIGYPVFKKAFLKLRRKDMFDENFLMSIATLGAIAINEIPEALGVMVFYTIGEYFQDRAISRSKNAISKLLDVTVNQAVVVTDGKHNIKKPNQVQPGEIVFVAKGAKVPCDGTIISRVNRCLTISRSPANPCQKNAKPTRM